MAIRKSTLGIVAAALLLFIATSPLWTVLLVRQQANLIVNDSLQELTTSSMLKVGISNNFFEMAIALSTTDPTLRTEKLAQIATISGEIDLLLKKYEAALENNGDRERFARLVAQRAAFRQTRQQAIDLLKAGRNEEAIKLYNRTGLAQFNDYLASIDEFVKDNVTEAQDRGAEILKLCRWLLYIQVALVVFFALYAFFVPMITVFERLTDPRSASQDI